MRNKIYFDNAATTKIFEEIKQQMPSVFEQYYANPNAIYTDGQESRKLIENSRRKIAETVGSSPEEIIFTSCATESNNTVIRGLPEKYPDRDEIIVSPIEHKSVLNPAKFLSKKGLKVKFLKVDRNGIVDIEQLKKMITGKTLLVSVIHGNNETGVIQDIETMGKICREREVFFFSDTVQSFMREKINTDFLDFFSVSGHKIGAPKGIGFFYKRIDAEIEPLLFGGGQERGLRSGTENVQFIKFISDVVEIWSKKGDSFIKKQRSIREYFERKLKEKIPDVKIVSENVERLPHISCVIFPHIDAQTMIISLDSRGIAVSSGSACSSGTPEPSHVLLSYGYSREEALRAVRFSFSHLNTEEEVDCAVEEIKKIMDNYRTFMNSF